MAHPTCVVFDADMKEHETSEKHAKFHSDGTELCQSQIVSNHTTITFKLPGKYQKKNPIRNESVLRVYIMVFNESHNRIKITRAMGLTTNRKQQVLCQGTHKISTWKINNNHNNNTYKAYRIIVSLNACIDGTPASHQAAHQTTMNTQHTHTKSGL